uniref:Retrotransposon gag domain-containing protein n=2 Tax=Caenorhabditis japonica TaxID=281687 RepID=A0A8R1IF40_CAEJA
MANQMASSQIFPVKATETRVLHATALSSEGPPPNPSVSDKSKKKCEDMRRAIENPREEEEEEEEERNMQEKSDYEKKKREKSVPAKLGQPIDNEQQAEIQPDADGVNEGQPPGILVITQPSTGDIQTTASSRRRSTRSMSPPRRITRSMSASQQPRINVFTMKTRDPDDNEVRNHLLTVLTDFARDTAEEVLERNPDASSDDIIDALRAQYEDQYSTQYRLDAIKACFQYAQEPVQDFYQRVRKLMREAQTGANRAEVIRV